MRHPPFDFAVVDEAQDVSVAQLRFLAALGDDRPNGLFFAGDLGQRIFQQPFSWKSLGVDIRGRSRKLQGRLPDLASDPNPGGCLLGSERDGRGRQQGETERYGFRVQRARRPRFTH